MAYTNLSDLFKGICDAIRAKKGTTGEINHQDIPSEITSISSGGGYIESSSVIMNPQLLYDSQDNTAYILITNINTTNLIGVFITVNDSFTPSDTSSVYPTSLFGNIVTGKVETTYQWYAGSGWYSCCNTFANNSGSCSLVQEQNQVMIEMGIGWTFPENTSLNITPIYSA